MNKPTSIFLLFFFLLATSEGNAQQINTSDTNNYKINPNPLPKIQRCGTMEYYEQLFKKNPSLRARFQENQARINTLKRTYSIERKTSTQDTLTVVIHFIGNASVQSRATDAILATQIDVLNEDYNAANADSTRIPASFKSLFGDMGVVFELAKTDPDGLPTNGIDRRVNSISFNMDNYDDAKTYATGGLDAWDPSQYINIWVTDFAASGLLGISVFPGDPRAITLHGVVCDYRAFGRGAPYLYSQFAQGRTVSHELGHFFNLRHIWGDDNGECTGSDFPNAPAGQDDTPNQGDHTFGNPDVPGNGTVVTDNCSTTAPGIMYQNYMDYTDDVDLVMFTNGQVSRMQTALNNSPDRMPLLNSTAFHPPVVYNYDARVKSIISPKFNSSFCNNGITPSIKLRNQGVTTITSITITTVINNVATSSNYSINLPYNSDTTLVLNAINGHAGNNVLKIFSSLPNGQRDNNTINDTAITSFKIKTVVPLVSSVQQGFDSPAFPPQNWDIVNPNNDMTWEWNPNYGAKNPGSAWFNDYNNPTFGNFDDLVMPNYSYQNADSIFINFQLAAAVLSDPTTTTIPIDTLTVLLSKDCGNTFTTVYKKWGVALQTTNHPTAGDTTEFFPASNNWRKDSINLGQWLGNSENQFEIAFRFTGNYENNLFLDDVNLFTKVLPPALKATGYLILPTVFQNQFAIWHYKQPTDLKYISIFSSSGQLVWTRQFSGEADNYIIVDLSNMARGIYIVNMGYYDKKNITQRVIKN